MPFGSKLMHLVQSGPFFFYPSQPRIIKLIIPQIIEMKWQHISIDLNAMSAPHLARVMHQHMTDPTPEVT
jgi:hypothetical protein